MTRPVLGFSHLLSAQNCAARSLIQHFLTRHVSPGWQLNSAKWGMIIATGICACLLNGTPLLAQEGSNSTLLERLHESRTQEVTTQTMTTVEQSTGTAVVESASAAPIPNPSTVADGSPPIPFAQPIIGPSVQGSRAAAPVAASAQAAQSTAVASSTQPVQSVAGSPAPVQSVAGSPAPVQSVATVSSRESLLGVTGYGIGQSSIGTGLDVIHYADDMAQRSTEIHTSLVHVPEGYIFPNVGPTERWIRVDLGEQQVIAYEGLTPVRAFIASTGLLRTQTVTGEFRVRMKVSNQVMSGDDFRLPNVQWVMYFHSEYALHGSYWHENFGNPMSHGCVNMTNADAKWLFDFAGPVWDGETVWYRSTEENPGTRVVVHQ